MALPGLGYLPFILGFHLQWNLDKLQSLFGEATSILFSVIFPGVKGSFHFPKNFSSICVGFSTFR